MSVPGLRNALVKVLRDYAARVELQRGCQGATRGDVRDLLTFHLQSQALSVIVTSGTNCSMCGKKSILCPGTHCAELRTFGCGHVAHLTCCLEALGYKKVLSRWISHFLTDGTRFTLVSICQSLLLRPQRKEFLEDLIIGDESWILFDSNAHRAVWLPRGGDPPTQAKTDLHSKKSLLCCFWDSRGILYNELLPQEHIVTGNVYASQLQKLADAVRERRLRRASVHLLHDNARLHVAKETRDKLEELGWDTSPHPPYSPDIAPSDYTLFPPLKAFLAKKKFTKIEDVERAISDFFDSQSPQFCEKGIADLPLSWDIVETTDGLTSHPPPGPATHLQERRIRKRQLHYRRASQIRYVPEPLSHYILREV
ncbi:hypothetical protein Y032_0791g2369 [Ancylostoma ceylanicum]|nr:hypothetical protein Y032_0791g2369 [Ancylostoma ceylanicum]